MLVHVILDDFVSFLLKVAVFVTIQKLQSLEEIDE